MVPLRPALFESSKLGPSEELLNQKVSEIKEMLTDQALRVLVGALVLAVGCTLWIPLVACLAGNS